MGPVARRARGVDLLRAAAIVARRVGGLLPGACGRCSDRRAPGEGLGQSPQLLGHLTSMRRVEGGPGRRAASWSCRYRAWLRRVPGSATANTTKVTLAIALERLSPWQSDTPKNGTTLGPQPETRQGCAEGGPTDPPLGHGLSPVAHRAATEVPELGTSHAAGYGGPAPASHGVCRSGPGNYAPVKSEEPTKE